ncbi:MAG: hypothetical protein A2Y40_01890 [Candidatus Margulisbacteria bacterium GWF2_35_9]|nr:MAG: hypothetical protein A2Y40_01890 [Candidatus Margulisbacteria bacterium GWF2_35_9]
MSLKKRIVFFFLVMTFGFSATLELGFQETKNFPIKGIVKYFVIDHSDYTEIEQQPNMLVVTGLKPGRSKIIVFTEIKEDERIIKTKTLYSVLVNPVKIVTYDKTNVDYSGNVFYSNINLGYGHSRSRSQFAQHNWDATYMYYKFDSQGDTPWGYMTNRLYIKNKADYQGVYRFTTKLQNSYGIFTIGDQYFTDKSNMIFPAQPLQGLSYDGVLNNLDIMLFYGNNNFGQWAAGMEREQRNSDLFMFGGINYNIDKNSYIGVNFNNYAGSLLFKTILSNQMDLYGEMGIDKSSDLAREVKLTYSNKKDLNAKISYHNYDENFYIPIGVVDYRGYLGWQYNANYNPNYYLSFKLDGENYVKSISKLGFDNYRNNAQLYFKGEEYNLVLPDISLDYNESRGKSENNYNYKQSQYVFRLKKKIYDIDSWFKYIPLTYTNISNSAQDYNKNSIVLGGKVPLLKNMYYQGEYSWENYDMATAADYAEYVYNSFFYVHSVEVLSTRLYLDGFFQYITRYNNNLRERYDNTYFSFGVNYHPNPDGHLRLSSYRKIIDEPDVYQRSRILDELRVEYSQNFNYTINFGKGRTQLTGMVFMDENYNGELDENEHGIAEIPVKLSNGEISTTNKFGVYRFKDVPANKYSLDIIEGDKKIMFTDEYPKYVQLNSQQNRVIVNFGVIMTNRIYGYAYADDNGNGVKDSGENTVYENVRIIIGDTIIKTNKDGYYEYLIQGAGGSDDVQIDFSSIPVFHKLVGQRKFSKVGVGRYDFIIEKSSARPFADDYLEIQSIDKMDGTQYKITGKIIKPVLSVYMNNQKIGVEDGVFTAVIPKNGDKIKIKVFTRDKSFFVKYFSY